MTRDRGFSDMIALIYRCTTSKILPVNLHSPSRLIPVRCKSFTYARSINLMLTSILAWRRGEHCSFGVGCWRRDELTLQPSSLVTWRLQHRDVHPALPCPARPGSVSRPARQMWPARHIIVAGSFGPNWDLSYIVVVALIGNWCHDRSFVRSLSTSRLSNNPSIPWRRLARCAAPSQHNLVGLTFDFDRRFRGRHFQAWA